jgi:uncharacterized integral membrane protein
VAGIVWFSLIIIITIIIIIIIIINILPLQHPLEKE